MERKTLVLFDCITGSRAYNLVSPTSDYDHRRVVTPLSLTYFFGLDSFEVGNVVTTKEEDSTDYSLQRFMKLVVSCSTVMLEMLFTPKDCHAGIHPLFSEYFVDARHEFLSKKIYESISNYAMAEHRRALGLTTRNLGERRKLDIEKYGYSPKNASHCVRLMYCGIVALKTGEFPVRLEGDIRELCYALKTYQIPKEEYLEVYASTLKDLSDAYLVSTLREDIDMQFLNQHLVDFYLELFEREFSLSSSMLQIKRANKH
jgi:predicted nucleotidyltransferase